jgi:uncharacterized protein (TIGR00369 family)
LSRYSVKLTVEELNDFLNRNSSTADDERPVREISPGRLRLVRPLAPGMLRPGEIISGPTLMTTCDMAAFLLVMAHAGDEMATVTSSISIHFLRGARPGDIVADAELLSFGRRSAVCDVRIWTEGPDKLAAQATATFARPLP